MGVEAKQIAFIAASVAIVTVGAKFILKAAGRLFRDRYDGLDDVVSYSSRIMAGKFSV